MISYIDEFEELIAGMDGGQGYIQNFIDGLSDLHIKNIILVRWNEGSIRTISEVFDLAMGERNILPLILQGLVMSSYS